MGALMSHSQGQVNEVEGGLMTAMSGYAQPLRAIGQALETLNLQSFELEPIGEDFYVRGTLTRSDAELSSDVVTPDKLSAIWGKIPGFGHPDRERQSRNGTAGQAQRHAAQPPTMRITAARVSTRDAGPNQT